MSNLVIGMLQMQSKMGGWRSNIDLIAHQAQLACEQGMDVLVCPELAVLGYPPEDLLYRADLPELIQAAMQRLCDAAPELYLVVGHPWVTEKGLFEGGLFEAGLFNAASVFYGGQVIATYCKQELPNYQVFDEKRYFKAGSSPCVISIKGVSVGLTICEDIWFDGPVDQAKAAGAELILNLNASPFHQGKPAERLARVKEVVQRTRCAVAYVNLVGGQDELVFDGGSFYINPEGRVMAQAPLFESALISAEFGLQASGALGKGVNACWPDDLAQAYQALVLGVRDYVTQNGFNGALIGLSGGIDSALTLAVAVDALGVDNVTAVMLPFVYTSDLSVSLAQQQADVLGVTLKNIPIQGAYEAVWSALEGELDAEKPLGVTQQNLQARIRGLLLMGLSNQTGAIVLTTGNKSELSVGYATLYGDMAGGFNVLKDVYKTQVYQLARHRNQVSPAIPVEVIERPPSAELAPDQLDTDSLPPYDELDQMLKHYIEEALSVEQIVEQGHALPVVQEVVRKVDMNEYKRRQGALGVRLSEHSFVRDRRYPVTYQWETF